MRWIQAVVSDRLRAGHARPLQGGGWSGWWYRQGARAACTPAPTGWWVSCERYRLGNTYKALQDPYRFHLDVTCGMVYTIGIRTVLFYYILYQLISDSVT